MSWCVKGFAHSEAERSRRERSGAGWQTRRQSAAEAAVNVLVGLGVAYATQVVAFPLFGLQADHATHAALTGIFTGVSLVRSYALRRVFNWWHCRR